MNTAKAKSEQATPVAPAKTAYAAVPEGGPSPVLVFLGGGTLGLALAVYAGILYGAPGVVLTLAAVALVLVIAAFWTSIRMLIGETKLSAADAYAIGAQHTEMEQKRAVLRALKDLEFERAVGKISEEDYRHLVARFRAEAKALLQVIDEKAQAKRARAEKVVGAHLKRKGIAEAEKFAWPTAASGTPGVSFEPIVDEPEATLKTGAGPDDVDEPKLPIEKPEEPAERPAEPTEKPVEPIEKPEEPIDAPGEPAEVAKVDEAKLDDAKEESK